MYKTSSQIADEVLQKLAAEKASIITKGVNTARNFFKGKKPGYVTPKQLEESMRGRFEQMKSMGWKGGSFKGADDGQLDQGYYEDTPSQKRHWPIALGGAAAGALGAHYLLPNQMTQSYRDTASGLGDAAKASRTAYEPYFDKGMERYKGKIPRELVKAHNVRMQDVSARGRPVSKLMPAHVAQKYFKSRAFAEAMPRTLLGAGLGLGAGILGSSMLQ